VWRFWGRTVRQGHATFLDTSTLYMSAELRWQSHPQRRVAATVRHPQQPPFYDQIIGEVELTPRQLLVNVATPPTPDPQKKLASLPRYRVIKDRPVFQQSRVIARCSLSSSRGRKAWRLRKSSPKARPSPNRRPSRFRTRIGRQCYPAGISWLRCGHKQSA